MSDYKTDLEIAREAKKLKISEVASKRLSIDEKNLVPYGHFKAKLDSSFINEISKKAIVDAFNNPGLIDINLYNTYIIILINMSIIFDRHIYQNNYKYRNGIYYYDFHNYKYESRHASED